MFFYVMLFMICVEIAIVNSISSTKVKRVLEIATLVILILVSGTRYYLGGTDYYAYEHLYKSVQPLSKSSLPRTMQLFEGTEKGFLILVVLVKSIGINFFGFTLIHSIIFYVLMYLGLKKYTDNFNFFIIVFLYKIFFYNTFISMRQSISIVLFFVSIKYIENRQPIKYWLLSAIAFMFHNSAIILFPIYFINKVKISKKVFAVIYIIGLIFLVLNISGVLIINPGNFINKIFSSNDTALQKSEKYFDTSNALENINLFHSLEYYLIAVILYFNYKEIKEKEEHADIIINLFIVLLPIFTVFRTFGIITRIKDYFIFTYPIILYYFTRVKEGKYKILIYISTITISIYGYTRYIKNFYYGRLMPYQSYITKNINIFEEKE